jgi:hypothetical protein
VSGRTSCGPAGSSAKVTAPEFADPAAVTGHREGLTAFDGVVISLDLIPRSRSVISG